MTDHLVPDEFVAALDGTLPRPRQRHLDACAACRDEVARLAAVVARMDDDVPEPEAGFWDDLGRRVRAATAAEPVPTASTWRAPLVAFGALAAGLVLAFTWWSVPERHRPEVSAPGVVSSAGGAEDPASSWQVMTEMAATMSAEDVRHVTAPHTTLVLSDLSADEREAFVHLLKSEMGDIE
jgi:hypothetical protein